MVPTFQTGLRVGLLWYLPMPFCFLYKSVPSLLELPAPIRLLASCRWSLAQTVNIWFGSFPFAAPLLRKSIFFLFLRIPSSSSQFLHSASCIHNDTYALPYVGFPQSEICGYIGYVLLTATYHHSQMPYWLPIARHPPDSCT